ncbi:MAG: autotransporter-associated beta strand repeat-containing protein, partial [Verrucomicrobiota bacterium]
MSRKARPATQNAIHENYGELLSHGVLDVGTQPVWKRLALRILTGVVILAHGVTASAATYTFTGSTSATYGDITNWSTSGTFPVPSAAGDAIIIGTMGIVTGSALSFTVNSAYKVGSISVTAPADLTLSDVTFSGSLGLDSGTSTTNVKLDAGAGTTLTLTQDLALSQSLSVNSSTATSTGSVTLSGTVSGNSKSITLNAGTLVLSGTNTYTGGTTVASGSLIVGGSSALGTGSVSVIGVNSTLDLAGFALSTSGSLSVTGTSTVTDSVGTGSITAASFYTESGSISAVLAGTGSLSKTTSGTVTLSGVNTYTGVTSVTGGSLKVIGLGTLGSGDVTVSGSSTTLYVEPTNLAVTGSLSVQGGATLSGTGSFSAGIFDLQSGTVGIGLLTGTLNKTTQDKVTLSGYALLGDVNVSEGSLVLGSAASLSSTGSLTVSGTSSMDIGGVAVTVGTFNLQGGTLNDTAGGGSLAVAAGGSFNLVSGTVNAVLAEQASSASLSKTGTGTVYLNAANTFSGSSTLSAGTVVVGTSSVTGASGAFGNDATGVLVLVGTSSTTPTLAANGGTSASATFSISNAVLSQGTVGFGTTSNTGTLQLTGAVTLDDNGAAVTAHTWDVAAGTTVQLSVALGTSSASAGTIGFVKKGNGTLSLGSASATTSSLVLSDFKISGGTVIVGSAGALGTSDGTNDVGVTLAGGTLRVDSGSLGYVDAKTNFTVSANSSIIVNGGTGLSLGTLTFSGGSQTLTFNAGTTSSSFTQGTLYSGTSGVVNNTFNVVSTTASSGSLTISSVLSQSSGGGAAKLVKTGNGLLILAENNTYSGGTQIDAGTVLMGSGKTTALGTGTLIINGGSLDMNGNTFTTGSFSISTSSSGSTGTVTGGTISASSKFDANVTTGTTTVDALLTGTARFEKSGAGTVILSHANTYTGGTTVSAGTLQLGISNALTANGAVSVSGGVLDLAGYSVDAGLMNVSISSGSLTSSSAGGTISKSDGNFSAAVDSGKTATISAILAGSAGFEKTRLGKVVIAGANTYYGDTSIALGELSLASGGSLGFGAVELSGGSLTSFDSTPVTVSNNVT